MRSWEARRKHASEAWLEERNSAERVDCPACGAPAGSTCTHPDGVPLGASPAHSERITAADKAAKKTKENQE
ncbi:zinc finger domain-containing protein [Prauserella endophytica]|uniref:DNA-binding phage zinc finger domain-containing protein n=1 Tax=Prauserella endophytica TaxID=1592324 RepID=A0ABY2S2H4_9PSEU|nr:hypothetical protein [Prauserella endophytica]TKG67032.1 hypothetical protein FCN18_24305 [Prauserella endophytica]